MRSIKRAATRSAAAMVILAGALTTQPSQASAAEFRPDYWSATCDYGRVCMWDPGGWIFNAEVCGYSFFAKGQRFYWGKAHGNSYRVWYINSTYDDVAAWSERPLDKNNTVFSIWVNC